jgi:hypothetical protein
MYIHKGKGATNIRFYQPQLLFTPISNLLLSKNITIRIHKTIILPVVLYGCETWSLILRMNIGLLVAAVPTGPKWSPNPTIPIKKMEERRVRVFENRVLMRIFGPKRDELTGD